MNRWQSNNGDNQMDDGGSKKHNKNLRWIMWTYTYIVKVKLQQKSDKDSAMENKGIGKDNGVMGWMIYNRVQGNKWRTHVHFFLSLFPSPCHISQIDVSQIFGILAILPPMLV
jgi:hypothetical protein